MDISISGMEFMGDNVRPLLRRCGESVRLYPLAKLAKPEVIDLDDFCRVRDFVFIYGGIGVTIGKHTDMQPHSVIWGGGEVSLGDRVSVGPGTVLLSAVYSYEEGMKMVDGLPNGTTKALYGKITVLNDVYIGANCTLMPNITVGEGAIIGAGSFANRDVEPWSIVVGSPARKIAMRPRGR